MENDGRSGSAPDQDPVGRGRESRRRPTSQAAEAQYPVVTLMLLLVMVGVFLAMERVGHGNVMAAAQQFGDKERDLIRAGEWWRLITPIFLHGSWMHLIVNGLSLVWFGGQMERLYGARRYLLIFMAAGVAGNLLSYWRLPTPSLGASGSLFGLVGAGIVFPLRFRNLIAEEARASILRQLVTVAAINFAISFSPGIDIYAHLGGFLGGGFMALFLLPALLDDRPRDAAREAGLTALTVLTLLVTFVAAWSQWRVGRRDTVEEAFIYGFGAPDHPWLTFELTARWNHIDLPNNPGVWWTTKDKAVLNVQDRPTLVDLEQSAQGWGTRGGLQRRKVGGKEALVVDVATQEGREELCVIAAFDHTVQIAMQCPPAAYPAAHRDLDRLLDSVRVLRPPDPAVVAQPPPHAAPGGAP